MCTLECIDPIESGPELIRQFEARLEILDRQLRVLENKVGVIGVLACGHVARWRSEPQTGNWRLDTLFPTRFMSLHGDDPADISLAPTFSTYMQRVEGIVLNLRTKVPKPL